MSNTNNPSPRAELVTDVKFFKEWVTQTNTVVSNKAKIIEVVHSIAIPACRQLNDYVSRFELILNNEKDENSEDEDVDFNDLFETFVIKECKWKHFRLFSTEIRRRMKQIEKFESHLLKSPASLPNGAHHSSIINGPYSSKKKNKKNKKKNKKKAHGSASNGNGPTDNPYALALQDLLSNEDSDDDDDDEEIVDTNIDAFTEQHLKVEANRSKRLNRKNNVNDTLCLVIQTFIQTNPETMEVHMAFTKALFNNVNYNIHDIKSINNINYALPGSTLFFLKCYFNWIKLNYTGSELINYMKQFDDLKSELNEFEEHLTEEALSRAVAAVITVGTQPALFKANVLIKWTAAKIQPKSVKTDVSIYKQLHFRCDDWYYMNNCTRKNCPFPHICECGVDHIKLDCKAKPMLDKNMSNLKSNLSFNEYAKNGYSNPNNSRRQRNNNSYNYRGKPRGRGRGGRGGRGGYYRNNYYNNNNNNNNNQDTITQMSSAFNAFLAAANAPANSQPANNQNRR